MIPASSATLASTIPGPPRALVVIARLIRSNPRNPAKRPASDTERILTTQLPTMKAAIIDNDTPRTRSSFSHTIAKYAGIKNANDTFAKASRASEKNQRFMCTKANADIKDANTRRHTYNHANTHTHKRSA